MKTRARTRCRWLAALLAFATALAVSESAAGDGRSLANAFGDTQLPADAQRVVTLYQGATDSAVALGITPVGVVDSWLEKPMYRYLREALSGVEHVGLETQPNLEKIAWLDPDLIVATHFRHERVRPLLEKIAPTVATESVFDFKESLMLVAKATGRESKARALLEDWDARVTDFRRQIAAALGDAWPQKAAVVRFKSDHVRIYSTGFAGSILDELGFEQPSSVQDQGWGMKLTSEENIPVMNADVIFVLLEPDDPAIAENYRHWRSHPLWQRLDAVQHGRIYEVDPVDWIMGGGILAANAMLDDLYAHYGLEPSSGDTQAIPASPTSAQTTPARACTGNADAAALSPTEAPAAC
ncbi:iron complex transport system substrate-binding protein [Onishia taeanensis]|uniref:Iron complex transport system substrate-binding protein n=1 Tax=Onishia taeanensis TaxID=284577 RepID=A0A1G7PMY6_9GAMM|nr:iron-siderophore ABC transporter substrate-binding protein [Halomonas taeanensis]SDF87641.1 iron complex transport system substrate-binding protein [Halomonas taeanensis]